LGSSCLMELVAVRALARNDVARKVGQPAELITCWAVVDRRTDWQTDVEDAEAFDARDVPSTSCGSSGLVAAVGLSGTRRRCG
jgi:hypothetical protein